MMSAMTVAPSVRHQLETGLRLPDESGQPILYRYLLPSDDIDALTALLHAAYAALAAAGMRFVASHQDVETTRRRLSNGETIVAVEGEQLIGTVTLKPPAFTKGSPFYDRPDVASVGQFAVAPAHQRRGVGTALGTLAERRARELGVGYLALDTSERALHLIAMYEAHGFRQVETVQWDGLNYRSVVMAKTLAGDAE